MLINVATFMCLAGSVLAALECTDWQGNTFVHGEELYPNKDDPCHKCLCDEGSLTMCRTVSCAPPNCPYLRKIPGQCCEFQCLTDTFENSTAIPPFDNNNGSPSNATMTDLGLRLVASTVTTFLILALLLFLIHRLRQRRLMLALRRYSRRREPLDDSDDISYSPEFFGIQCPPYEDPPPPYSPPKPPHFRLGEQPPPYEAIDSNTNNQNDCGDGGRSTNVQSTNRANAANGSFNGASSGVNNFTREINHLNSNGANRNGRLTTSDDAQAECIEMTQIVSSPERNRNEIERNEQSRNRRNESAVEGGENEGAMLQNSLNVHFRNSLVGLPSITMGVQNRRFNRNRLSEGNFNAHRNFVVNGNPALNLEIRNTINNGQRNVQTQNRHSYVHSYQDNSSSTTDIGESTTSAESLQSSPNTYSPDSPEAENENATMCQSVEAGEAFPDDADLTVRQFLDRQFGRGSKIRRYPTTMSQSWTSSHLNSSTTMPSFRQSVSIGSFQPTHFDQADQPKPSKSPAKPLPRSKSEHLKTNGSLRSQPYKGTVRTQPTFLPHTGFAARVSYVEADNVSGGCENQRFSQTPDASSVTGRENTGGKYSANSGENRASNDNRNNGKQGPISSHSNSSIIDSNLGECSTSLNSSHPHVHIDPGDIIVTRRQDALRELRLSHLLHNPGNISRGLSGSVTGAAPLQRSHSFNSVCSETGEKSLGGVAISNDMQYPSAVMGSMQGSSQSSPAKSAKKISKTVVQSNSVDINGNINNASSSSSMQESRINEVQRTAGPRQNSDEAERLQRMSMSWHGGVVESSDDNSAAPWAHRSDTLGRNVNSNFTKKTCADKDVSNLCFPLFKPTNFDVCPSNGVPSSGMRACASQLYNLETEEKFSKKDKKKHFLKRHSASCFPAKRDSSAGTSQSPSRLTHKIRSSFSKERQNVERPGEDLISDSHKKSHSKKSSSRDRKTCSAERAAVHKPRQYFEDTNGVVTDLTPPCLIHSNITPPVSILDSKVQPSEGASVDAVIGSRQRGNRSGRRSKSLGRCENIHSSATDKRAELCPNHRAQGRKKKSHSRQSFPGTHSFHQELEHVLEKQRSAIKTSVHGMNDHSITRV